MMTSAPRFWPTNPGSSTPDDSPGDILRAAAAELEGLTAGTVSAELRSHRDGEDLRYDFYLLARRADYRFLLFRASLDRIGYPVTIFDRPGDASEPLPSESTCLTPEALEGELKALFTRAGTNAIIAQLRKL